MLVDDPGFVLAFQDGEVSTGVERVRDAILAQQYGYGDYFTLHYNHNGTLIKPATTVQRGEWDENGFAYHTYYFYLDDVTTVPFYYMTIRVDGNV